VRMSNNTHFVFHHKVFSVEGSHFSAKKGGRDPCFNMPLGDAMASIALATLRGEFAIAEDSEDSRLLTVVQDALKHVKIIRVNDAIPSELLDGTASWSVDDRHRLVARCRLAQQLVAWLGGTGEGATDLAEFQRQIETPEIKEKIREAIGKIAQQLGIADQAADVIDKRIEILAHEMSYIEGLRERFGEIQAIHPMVTRVANADDQSLRIQEDSARILVLLSLSYKKIGSEFDLLVKQFENIMDSLGAVETYVQMIRSVRDEIRAELVIWDELIEEWRAYTAKESDGKAAQVIEHTYRFLAQNYPIVQVW
jgi:hypothetical protein